MLECVPNFSVGRDPAVVRAIVDAIAGTPGAVVLAWESDADHNRTVVTLAGPDDAVVEAAVRGAGKAAERIDLSSHRGVHPRVGAADVIPFIPLEDTPMTAAVAAAHRAGEQLWKRFGVPVYFYGRAARHPERQRLEKIRRAGFDGQPPDLGDVAAHPTAGASMVGARDFLVAYNIQLATADVGVARAIARQIRESSGGIRHVKAIGLDLASHACAQVSMNLTNFRETGLDDVWDTVARLASELGTEATTGEIIGLIPRAAYQQAPRFFERAANFDSNRILENRLETASQ